MAKPKGTIDPKHDQFVEKTAGAWNWLRENANAALWGMAGVILVAGAVSWWRNQAKLREMEAQAEHARLAETTTGKALAEAREDFTSCLQRVAGTTVEPIVLLEYAARLSRSADRADLEEALGLLRKIRSRWPRRRALQDLAEPLLHRVEADLAFTAPGAPAPTGGGAPGPGPVGPLTQPARTAGATTLPASTGGTDGPSELDERFGDAATATDDATEADGDTPPAATTPTSPTSDPETPAPTGANDGGSSGTPSGAPGTASPAPGSPSAGGGGGTTTKEPEEEDPKGVVPPP